MGPAALLNIVVNAQTGQATAALTKTQAQLKAVAATAETSSARIGKAATAASARLAALARTGALAGGVVAAASTKMAFDFEESMMKVRNLVGASEKQVDEWGDALLKMAGKVGKSPQELADTLYFVSSAGIKTSKVLNTVKIAAEASALGLGDSATIADSLTSAMNAYAKSGLSAKDATNVLVKTVKFGKLEADSLAQSIGRVIPVASKLNVPFEDVGASLAAMSLQGLDAAESTTALRAIFTSMIKPTDASEKALSSVGLSAESLRDSLEQDGTLATLQMLSDKFDGNVESIGEVFPNVRALVGAFNLTGDSAKQNAKIYEALGMKTDDLGKGFERLSETPTQRMRAAIASIQAVMTKFGEKVLPVAADALKDFADILSDEKLTSDEKITAILDKISGVVDKALPKIAEVGAKLGWTLIKGLGKGFLNSGILGKLFIAAAFVRLIGGKGALLKIGVALGKTIGARMGVILAAEGAAAASTGAAMGKWTSAGRVVGKAFGIAAAAYAGYQFAEHFQDDISGIAADIFGGSNEENSNLLESLTGIDVGGPVRDALGLADDQKKLETPDWEKTLGLANFEKTRKQIGGGHRDLWGDITRQTGRGSDDTEDRTRTNHQRVRDGFEDTRRKLDDVTRKQAQDVGGNVGRMVDAVGEGLKTLGSNTNKALQAFGAKKVGFSIDSVGDSISGALKRQRGGMIPGLGNTDSVPTMLTPGEGVITKTAVGKWGGPAFIDFINHAQHLAGGGVVTGDTDYLPALGQALMSMSASTGRSISVQSGGRSMAEQQALYARYLAGGNLAAVPNANAPHVRGIAADITPGREAFGSVAGKFGLGFPVSSESWHVELLNAAAAGKMGITAQKVARLLLKGPDGPLKSMGQGALDKARSAANSFIASQMPTVSAGFGGISTKGLGSGPAANRELGRKMMLTMFGADQWSYLDHLWGTDEGRWDENLANLAGSGAYGIAQALPSSKYPLAGQPSAPPGIEKARAQIGWGLDYIDERYGNPAAADDFRHRIGWYAKGGLVEKFAAQIPQFHDGGMFRAKRPGGEGLAMLRDREIVSTQHDIGHLRKRLRDDGLDNKDRQRIELQIELLKTIVAQNAEAQRERKAIRRQGDQTKRLNRQEVARFLSEELGAGLGQMGSRRALGTAGSGSVGRY